MLVDSAYVSQDDLFPTHNVPFKEYRVIDICLQSKIQSAYHHRVVMPRLRAEQPQLDAVNRETESQIAQLRELQVIIKTFRQLDHDFSQSLHEDILEEVEAAEIEHEESRAKFDADEELNAADMKQYKNMVLGIQM